MIIDLLFLFIIDIRDKIFDLILISEKWINYRYRKSRLNKPICTRKKSKYWKKITEVMWRALIDMQTNQLKIQKTNTENLLFQLNVFSIILSILTKML